MGHAPPRGEDESAYEKGGDITPTAHRMTPWDVLLAANAVLLLAAASIAVPALESARDLLALALVLQMPAVLAWSRARFGPSDRSTRITIVAMWVAVVGLALEPSPSAWGMVVSGLAFLAPACMSWELWGARFVSWLRGPQPRHAPAPAPVSRLPERDPATGRFRRAA